MFHGFSHTGMAIVRGGRSRIGYYQYKCSGGNWTEVNVSNTIPLGRSDEISVIYLKPSDELRFTLSGNNFWTRLESTKLANLKFLAWDMTDMKSCGKYNINVSAVRQNEFLSIFKDAAILTQLRKGCDGKAGTVGQLDACGECQGDNSTCTDCAGVVLGSAILGILIILFVIFPPENFS